MPDVKRQHLSDWDAYQLFAKLSHRHRSWGWDCPTTNLDFVLCYNLMVEYDHRKPVALIEYKHEATSFVAGKGSNAQVIKALGNMAGIAAFAVVYSDNFSRFIVEPLNSHATKWASSGTTLNEKDYVSLLYRIRGRLMGREILDGLVS